MLTFRDIQNCEGYYYNVETGDILRNVGPAKPAAGPKDHGSRSGLTMAWMFINSSWSRQMSLPHSKRYKERWTRSLVILPDVLSIGRLLFNRMVLWSRKKRE